MWILIAKLDGVQMTLGATDLGEAGAKFFYPYVRQGRNDLGALQSI